MIDTSALVAALIEDHEHHELARGHARNIRRVPAIVLAETYAQLRRTFRQPAVVVTSLLQPWWADPKGVIDTSGTSVVAVMARAAELDLGGNIHDALVAQVCVEQQVPLVTLDRRQHTVALAFGARSTYLLA